MVADFELYSEKMELMNKVSNQPGTQGNVCFQW